MSDPLPVPSQIAGRALRTRAAVAFAGLGLLLVLLVARLVKLQIADADIYRDHADRQQIVDRELSAPRGRIYDSRGRLLATSVLRWSIYADPHGVRNPAATAAALGRLLGVEAGPLAQKLQKDCHFVWVKRQVSNEPAERVSRARLPGVYMRRESARIYPHGVLAAHVLGFTDVDGRGLAGVERHMDALLRGRPGMETVCCDGGRRVFQSLETPESCDPFNGLDVQLTLDACIQEIAEQELTRAFEKYQPQAAVAIVLDARDCSILALACRPVFDPASPAKASASRQRNVGVSDAYEFGSVMKPFTAALALDRGVVTPTTQFDCHQGTWQIGRRTLHDAHGYGVLSVADIVSHSSNIGMAQVALLCRTADLHDGLCDFGFGQATGVALPGEVGGVVRPLGAWSDYTRASVAFGHEMAATPLGVARAFATFVNNGYLLQPRIVQSVAWPETGKVVYSAGGPVVLRRVVGPEAAAQTLAMLRRVVTEGTGKQAELSEYPMAGKTGTAQMVQTGGRGYASGRYLGSFVGIAPVPDARVVVLVTISAPTRGGYYGGVVAAPAVKEITRRTLSYLGVPPVAAPEGETI